MSKVDEILVSKALEYRKASVIRLVEDQNRAEGEPNIYELSVSSEEPYKRWWGTEILDHGKKSIRMDRLNDGAAVLIDHYSDQIGVVEKAWIDDKDKKLRARIRFSKSTKGKEVEEDVKDGIRKNVSIGYKIHELALESKSDDEETYRVTDWEPFEISVVSVPADPTVGFGRKDELIKNKIDELRKENNVQVKVKDKIMEEKDVKTEEKVDVKDVLQKERERISEIRALEQRHGLDLSEHVKKNTSIEEIRGIVLDKIGDSKPLNTPTDHVDLDNKQKKQYSIARALNYLVEPNKYRDEATLEREVSDQITKQMEGKAPRGIYVLQRDMSVGLASNYGSDLVGTDHMGSEFIDLLRNKMLSMQLGAKPLSGLVGNVSIPKWASAATAAWSATEGAGASESTPGTSVLTLSPKEISANVDYTRQLFLQSDPSVDMLIKDDLAKVLAIGIDLAVFHGSGSSGQPTGIVGTSGVGTTTISAATLAKMLLFESDIETANVESGNLAFVSTPAVKAALKGRDIGSDTGQHIVTMDNKCLGYDFHATNQVSTGYIIFGDFSQVIIGEWGGLDLFVDRAARTGIVTVSAFKTIDVGVRQPGAFSYGSSFS